MIGATSSISGFDPAQMLGKLQDKMQQMDTDGDGAIAKSEFDAAVAGKSDRLNQLFEQADVNADGELSAEEQQAAIDRVEAKLETVVQLLSGFGGNGNSLLPDLSSVESTKDSALESLIESLTSQDDTRRESYQEQIALQAYARSVDEQ